MSEKPASISSKSLWTMGTYAASAGIRFSTNIVLSRLLGPEVLGVVVIAQAVRAGTELLTDLGLEQNVVHSSLGDDERFLNTVWTIQILRGLLISLVYLSLTPLLAGLYHIDIRILLAMGAAPLLNSLTSTSIFTLSKRLDVRTRNLFELVAEAIGLGINITLAFTIRDVWAPIFGILLAIAARSAISYLMPHPRHRFAFDRVHAPAIFHFSKWIMLSSLALYAVVYVDRLFLGRMVTLAMLGVYGLARAVSDLPQTVAGRLAFQIVFPFVAGHKDQLGPSGAARGELARTRRNFLLLILIGVATVMAWSDWAVRIVYGTRYIQAGWMLCILLVGSWLGTLASLNEAILFGQGKPQNVSLVNTIRLVVMCIVLPGGFALGGLPGALIGLPMSELARYLFLVLIQRRTGLLFVRQEALLSLALVGLFGAWVIARFALGLGVPWAHP